MDDIDKTLIDISRDFHGDFALLKKLVLFKAEADKYRRDRDVWDQMVKKLQDLAEQSPSWMTEPKILERTYAITVKEIVENHVTVAVRAQSDNEAMKAALGMVRMRAADSEYVMSTTPAHYDASIIQGVEVKE